MKPIQLPKETIEALVNGATKFLLSADEIVVKYIITKLLAYNGIAEGYENGNPYEKELKEFQNMLDTAKYNYTLIALYAHDEDFGIRLSSPLQIGDTFYVQEEFTDYEDISCGYATYSRLKTFDASQMTCEQSRVKGKIVNVEVKRVQDVSHNSGEIYEIYPDAHNDGYDNFMHGFNEKFLDGKYDQNPYIFIYTIGE